MLATSQYDFICYQVRNGLYTQIDDGLQKDVDSLSVEIKKILNSSQPISNHCNSILSRIFDLRMKAIRYVSEHMEYYQFGQSELFEAVEKGIEEIAVNNNKLTFLKENILFAVRCSNNIVNQILSQINTNQAIIGGQEVEFKDLLKNMPPIDFNGLSTLVMLAEPNDEHAQMVVDWIKCSLLIEFVAIAADIVSDENIPLSEAKIDELSFIIVNAAQDYSALAIILNIVPGPSSKTELSIIVDDEFIKKQQLIADIGINDFETIF